MDENIIDGQLATSDYDGSDSAADYENLTRQLVACFPAIAPTEIDWQLLKGPKRQTKAIVLWLVLKRGMPPMEVANRIDEPVQKIVDLLYEAVSENTDHSDIETIRRMELLKLDYEEQDAKACRERSKQDAEEHRQILDKEGNVVTLKTVKPQAGDPRWGTLLQKIRDSRAKLTGMDQPSRVSVTKDVRQIRVNVTEVKERPELAAPAAAPQLEHEQA